MVSLLSDLLDDELWMTVPKWFVTIFIFVRLSPVWILWWTARFEVCLKALPHTSQLYSFSLIWYLQWITNFAAWLKALPHTSHLCGFSQVWILQCIASFVVWLKALSHTSHLYGFPPVWILCGLVSSESWRKVMSYSLHLSGLFFCVSWSSSSSEGCITAFSCLWEKPLQTLQVLWDDEPEALTFVTTWLHSKIIPSDCTICNSSWKVDPCLSKGLFPASLLLWWSLPSVRFCYGM